MRLGANEIETELDIVRFVRRLRTYGIALHYLTTSKEKIIISRMAAYKGLRDNDVPKGISWGSINNQNFQDRFK